MYTSAKERVQMELNNVHVYLPLFTKPEHAVSVGLLEVVRMYSHIC
jgi:hypothetical protein